MAGEVGGEEGKERFSRSLTSKERLLGAFA